MIEDRFINKNKNIIPDKDLDHYEDKSIIDMCGVSRIYGGRMYMLHINEYAKVNKLHTWQNGGVEADACKDSVYTDRFGGGVVIGPLLATHNIDRMDESACFAILKPGSTYPRLHRLDFRTPDGGYVYQSGFGRCHNTYRKMLLYRVRPFVKSRPSHMFVPVSSRSKLYKSSIQGIKDCGIINHSNCYNKAFRFVDKNKNIVMGNPNKCPCYTIRRKLKN